MTSWFIVKLGSAVGCLRIRKRELGIPSGIDMGQVVESPRISGGGPASNCRFRVSFWNPQPEVGWTFRGCDVSRLMLILAQGSTEQVITGTVDDESGPTVPDAAVKVRNVETGVKE